MRWPVSRSFLLTWLFFPFISTWLSQLQPTPTHIGKHRFCQHIFCAADQSDTRYRYEVFPNSSFDWNKTLGDSTNNGRISYNYGTCSTTSWPCDEAGIQPGGRKFASSWQLVKSKALSESNSSHDIDVDFFVFGGYCDQEYMGNDLWR